MYSTKNPGRQLEEEQGVVHHVQIEHYQSVQKGVPSPLGLSLSTTSLVFHQIVLFMFEINIQIKRVFDMIPTNIGLIKNGPLSYSMKIRSLRRSFNANPSRRRRTNSRLVAIFLDFYHLIFLNLSRHLQLFVKRSDPRKYLGWLNSFRKPSLRQPRK